MKIPCCHCGIIVHKRPRDLRASKSGRVYCSVSCHHRDINTYTICTCGVEFPDRNGRRKFCSRFCANKSRIGMKYTGTPRNDHYVTKEKNKQKLVAERGPTCERCGYDVLSILVVHHVKERKDGGTNVLNNLELLCPNCHALHHYGSKEASETF